jgi:FdhE protein
MTAVATALTGLKRQRPEWGPWLAVVEDALREAAAPAWDAAVPADAPVPQITAPLLAGARLALDAATVHGLLHRLIRLASRSGTPEMATLRSVLKSEPDVLVLFRASLCQENEPIVQAAAACGADGGALQAVVALVSVPFLRACNRRWAPAMRPGWVEGYCLVCGAWPAFAETRGIERNRFFRCGRCGGEWHARPLRCPFCGTDDHNALVSLVPEDGGLNAVIEGCRSCRGYVKTFTRLQGCSPDAVMLDDLASVHLDVAALEQGYTRRAGAGHPLDVTVTGKNGARRFFAWNA